MNPSTPSPAVRRQFVAAAIRLLAASLAGLALFTSPAVAQDPPPGNMRVTRAAPNTYTVSVATGSLWEYTVEASNDLFTWNALDVDFYNDPIFLPGDGGRHSQRVVVPSGAVKAFFRYRLGKPSRGLNPSLPPYSLTPRRPSEF